MCDQFEASGFGFCIVEPGSRLLGGGLGDTGEKDEMVVSWSAGASGDVLITKHRATVDGDLQLGSIELDPCTCD